MPATIRDLAAKREGDKVKLSGTIDAPSTGWTVEVKNSNDGIAGHLDTTTHARVSATGPTVGHETLTQVAFDEEIDSPDRDTVVAVTLVGVTTENGQTHIGVDIT